jgi:hypothetical protein
MTPPLSSSSKSLKAFDIAPLEVKPKTSATSFATNQGSLFLITVLIELLPKFSGRLNCVKFDICFLFFIIKN